MAVGESISMAISPMLAAQSAVVSTLVAPAFLRWALSYLALGGRSTAHCCLRRRYPRPDTDFAPDGSGMAPGRAAVAFLAVAFASSSLEEAISSTGGGVVSPPGVGVRLYREE